MPAGGLFPASLVLLFRCACIFLSVRAEFPSVMCRETTTDGEWTTVRRYSDGECTMVRRQVGRNAQHVHKHSEQNAKRTTYLYTTDAECTIVRRQVMQNVQHVCSPRTRNVPSYVPWPRSWRDRQKRRQSLTRGATVAFALALPRPLRPPAVKQEQKSRS